MTARELLIWGGTGQAKVLSELFGEDYRVVAVADRALQISPFDGAVLLRDEAEVERWLADRPVARQLEAAVAIGGHWGAERRRLGAFLAERGVLLPTFIHSTARVARDATFGQAAQILIGAIVAAGAEIGSSVIINSGAQVDHGGRVADGAHVGPGAVAAGEVVIGQDAFIGAGAVLLPRVRVGERAVVGAGAVVVGDVPPDTVVVGCPARPITTSRGNERG